jgi:transcriptional regulator with XRE-family HTH domain
MEILYLAETLNMEISLKDIVQRVDSILAIQSRSRAEVCRSLKMSNSTFTEWADGTMPSIEKFVKVANYLKISVSSLLFGEPAADLPEDQRKLLESYENLDDQGKKLALDQIEGLLKHFPQKNISEDSMAK